MKFFSFVLLLKMLFLATAVHAIPKVGTFKKELLQIHHDHRFTFFCDQPFTEQGKTNYQGCTECPFIAVPIQWMPIVPYKRIVEDKLCYQEKICLDSNGKRFKGLRCCQQINPLYHRMVFDMHNLVPEQATLKKMRGNFNFGLINQKAEQTSHCHFYIDKKKQLVEPSFTTRGMIARTYFYMRDTYGLRLSNEETNQFLQWHYAYTATNWEYVRNSRIQNFQGNENLYVGKPV